MESLGTVLIALAILVVVAVAGIIFALKSSSKKKKKTGDSIIILGSVNSGKTVLFLQIRDKKFRETHTSMKQNEDTFPIETERGTKTVSLVDIPGHSRVRNLFTDYLPVGIGVVYVVDAVDFDNQIRTVAEFLFDIITNKTFSKRRIPLQIACNKSDMLTARTKEFIKRELEKEIEQMRHTRKSVPDQINDNQAEDVSAYLGNETFQFENLENPVTFCSISAKEGDIKPVLQFIEENIK